MYKELIEKLRCCVEQIRCGDCRYVKDCDGDRMMMSEAADAIEELSNAGSIYGKAWTLGYDAGRDENKPHWIPVTERLPERECYVLAYEDGDILMASYAGRNWVLRDMYEVIDDIKHTQWMPLPEPPKEET